MDIKAIQNRLTSNILFGRGLNKCNIKAYHFSRKSEYDPSYGLNIVETFTLSGYDINYTILPREDILPYDKNNDTFIEHDEWGDFAYTGTTIIRYDDKNRLHIKSSSVFSTKLDYNIIEYTETEDPEEHIIPDYNSVDSHTIFVIAAARKNNPIVMVFGNEKFEGRAAFERSCEDKIENLSRILSEEYDCYMLYNSFDKNIKVKTYRVETMSSYDSITNESFNSMVGNFEYLTKDSINMTDDYPVTHYETTSSNGIKFTYNKDEERTRLVHTLNGCTISEVSYFNDNPDNRYALRDSYRKYDESTDKTTTENYYDYGYEKGYMARIKHDSEITKAERDILFWLLPNYNLEYDEEYPRAKHYGLTLEGLDGTVYDDADDQNALFKIYPYKWTKEENTKEFIAMLLDDDKQICRASVLIINDKVAIKTVAFYDRDDGKSIKGEIYTFEDECLKEVHCYTQYYNSTITGTYTVTNIKSKDLNYRFIDQIVFRGNSRICTYGYQSKELELWVDKSMNRFTTFKSSIYSKKSDNLVPIRDMYGCINLFELYKYKE